MTKPIRILECVNIMDRAGLETMLMNYYRAIDRSVVQFDFLTHRPDRGEYDDEIEELGGRVFHAPRLYPQNYLKYHKWMQRFFAEHDYPVVHSHIDAMSAFPLAEAKKAGVPIRIAHSHNDSIDKDFKYLPKQIARKMLPLYATNLWACSLQAGIFLFGKKNINRIKILHNAINLRKYAFNEEERQKVRRELKLENNEIVIGHVGRLEKVKNQSWIIQIAYKLSQDHIPFSVVLAGEGAMRQRLQDEIDRFGLTGKVRLIGVRNDIEKLIQAFDIVVFPSLHEGIPLALIEAQASGIPIVASDQVSPEALITSHTTRLSLKDSVEKWEDTILKFASQGRESRTIETLAKSGYDVTSNAQELQKAYLELWNKGVSKV